MSIHRETLMTTIHQQPELDPQFTASLLQETRAGLIAASAHEESGLSQSQYDLIRSRALAATRGADGRPQVRIESAGLTLDQKLFIERALLRHLDAHDFPLVSVYFQRNPAPLSSQTAAASPAPIKPKAPFGLTIQKQAIPGIRHVVVVASGKGGVGKSTVAANLAVSLAASGLKVGLMDCDVYGPSAPMMLGVKGTMPVDGGRLTPLMGHHVKVVSFGFLSDAKSPVIWRGPMVAKAIEQLCYDVNWGELDTLVVDLPPGTGDVQLTLAEKLPISGAVIVTTPQDVALIDAHKAVSMFEKLGVPIFGVVENMAYHTCTACGHQDHIFGSEAFSEFLKSRNLNLLTRIPLTREIRECSDNGKPAALAREDIRRPYTTLAQSFATILAPRNTLFPEGDSRT